MKKYILLFLLCMFTFSVFSQNITGKWHCAKKVVKHLHIGFDDVSCIYRFKKNGTLIIKIDGDTYVNHGSVSRKANHHQCGCIYIRGTYIVCDGKISSHIRNEDVETFAVESQNVFMEENGKTPPSAFVSEIKKENAYGKGRARILRSKLMDYRFLWDWDEEIISVKNGELIIGKELVCTRR